MRASSSVLPSRPWRWRRLTRWRKSRPEASAAGSTPGRSRGGKRSAMGWRGSVVSRVVAWCFAGEEAGAPVDDAAGREAAGIGEDDEGGQVLAFAAESVGDPGAHAGEAGQGVPGVHEEATGPVEGGGAFHGVDEGEVVDAPRQPGKEVADPASGFAVPAEGPLAGVAVAGFGGEELQFPIGVEGLSGAFLELGFVIEGVDVAPPARAENLDDALRPRGEMRRRRPASRDSIAARAMPPKPPPAVRRKWRRERVGLSVDINKFVRVEEGAAEAKRLSRRMKSVARACSAGDGARPKARA